MGYVARRFERRCPHIVVSVHPLTQHIFARVLKELNFGLHVPLVSVVTDPCYGFWKGWACNDVSLYLVESEDARRQLIDYGVPPEKIKISGLSVHPKFAYPGEEAAQAVYDKMGIDAGKFIFVQGENGKAKLAGFELKNAPVFLLYVFLSDVEHENVFGDLLEEYEEHCSVNGKTAASLWLYKQILGSIWPLLYNRIRSSRFARLIRQLSR